MKHAIFCCAAVVISLGVIGCGTSSGPETRNPADPSSSAEGHSEHAENAPGDHTPHDGGGPSDMEKMTAELAKLSPEDAASAGKQHMCPVSGQMLGAMGAPIKVEVQGQQVWICCEGCREPLLEDPDKFLAKLNI